MWLADSSALKYIFQRRHLHWSTSWGQNQHLLQKYQLEMISIWWTYSPEEANRELIIECKMNLLSSKSAVEKLNQLLDVKIFIYFRNIYLKWQESKGNIFQGKKAKRELNIKCKMDSLGSKSAVEKLNQLLDAKINTDYYLLFLTLIIRWDNS